MITFQILHKIFVVYLLSTSLLACTQSIEKQSSSPVWFPIDGNAQRQTDMTDITSLTAFGNKGISWRVMIHDSFINIQGDRVPTMTIPLKRIALADSLRFKSYINDTEVNIDIKRQKCQDDNGNFYTFTATFFYNGQTYEGCAIEGAIPIAPT